MVKTSGIFTALQRLLVYSRGSEKLLSSLTEGEEFEAKVLRYTAKDKALVTFKNLKVTAEVRLPFHEGEKIKVKVESIKPAIVVRLRFVMLL